MSDISDTVRDRDVRLENFAAELTSAVYPLALRHGMRGSWITLQLGLWRALAETVKKWARDGPPVGSSAELKAWREGLLVDLPEEAFHISLQHGIQGFPLEVELGLYRALRSVIRRLRREAAAAPGRSA